MELNEQITTSITNVDSFFRDCSHLLSSIREDLELNHNTTHFGDNTVHQDSSTSLQFPEKWMPYDLYQVVKIKETGNYIVISIPLRDNKNNFRPFDKIELLIGLFQNVAHIHELHWYGRGFLLDEWSKVNREKINDNLTRIDPQKGESASADGGDPKFSDGVIYHEGIFQWSGNISEKLKEAMETIVGNMSR